MDKKIIIIIVFVTVTVLLSIVISRGIIYPIFNKDTVTVQDESSPPLTEDNFEIVKVSENPSDFYTVTIIDTPIYEDEMKEVTFSLNMKNIKIDPFITNIGINTCTLKDNTGKSYSAFPYGNEIQLDKAIIPGEDVNIEFSRIGFDPKLADTNEVTCKGEPGTSLKNFKKCIFNSNGECVCNNIGKLVLHSCEIAISNQNTQASNGWGMYQQEVFFKE